MKTKFSTIAFILLLGLLFSCKKEPVSVKTTDLKVKFPSQGSSSGESSTEVAPPKDKFNTGAINWLKIDDLPKNKKGSSKKYLIDVYTTWCGWCKIMDKKTFTNPDVQRMLKENFHVAKFDAESKESVNFGGEQYNWRDDGRKGVNTLAVKLLDSRLTYPTLVYLDEDMNRIKVSAGYKNPEQLLAELEVIIRS